MLHAVFLVPLLPLAGFVVLLAVGRRVGEPAAGWIGTAAVGGSFVAACVTLAGLAGQPAAHRVLTCSDACATTGGHAFFDWITVGGLQVKAAILLDPLSMTMAMFVTGVSALIHLYSIGYMKGDRDFTKFFVYLNAFVFSMLVLVLSSNLLVTFVGWEGVGLCSYWLIAFWFHRDSAASAGKKAFLYNRIGDAGFLLAMFLIFAKTGTLSYLSVFAHRHLLAGGGAATAAVLLLFLAATGKSAQIPLFNWLPDAMEGPTPVSALIHAATMVTAGVYLLCRVNPLLALSPDAMWVIAAVGGVTAFVAATIAAAQQDIKKGLAFSTVSQLGYMVLAVGTGAYVAAIFLMLAHAFYKALLFLGAGSVIHGLEDEQDMKRMGGLRRLMPWTFATFMFAWLAIAAVPPFSGFWAKGDILSNVYAKTLPLYALGLLTAFFTAYYMSRIFFLTFTGRERWREAAPDGRQPHHPPHEAPWVMRAPLVVLAFFAVFAGAIDLPWVHAGTLVQWLAPVFGHRLFVANQSTAAQVGLAVADAVVAVAASWAAWRLWRRTVDRPALEPAFLQRVWYWDYFYDAVLGRPGQAIARACAVVVDGRIIDGAVNGMARLVRSAGSGARRMQTGYVRNYLLGIAFGLAAILCVMLTRTWWS